MALAASPPPFCFSSPPTPLLLCYPSVSFDDSPPPPPSFPPSPLHSLRPPSTWVVAVTDSISGSGWRDTDVLAGGAPMARYWRVYCNTRGPHNSMSVYEVRREMTLLHRHRPCGISTHPCTPRHMLAHSSPTQSHPRMYLLPQIQLSMSSNLAWDMPTATSGEQDMYNGGNNAVDSSSSSRWASAQDGSHSISGGWI